MNMQNYLNDYVEALFSGLTSIISSDLSGKEYGINSVLEMWVDKAKNVKDKKGMLFFAGNGASATMAEHLSHDCFQNADILTQTCAETSHLTAISNDISYEEVFSYRIGKMCCDKDMLITISSSGNSPNIIKAIETARQKDMFIVTVSGKSIDNKSRKMGDLNFYVPLETYGMVESAHASLLHCWLDMFLDKYMNGRH